MHSERALIELHGLQSQRQSVSTRLRSRDAPPSHVRIVKLFNRLHGSAAEETLGTTWESCLAPRSLLQNESPLAVNEGEVPPCRGPLGPAIELGEHSSVILFDLSPAC